jgi:hypothetical protein
MFSSLGLIRLKSRLQETGKLTRILVCASHSVGHDGIWGYIGAGKVTSRDKRRAKWPGEGCMFYEDSEALFFLVSFRDDTAAVFCELFMPQLDQRQHISHQSLIFQRRNGVWSLNSLSILQMNWQEILIQILSFKGTRFLKTTKVNYETSFWN